jgi:hypothetical protein
MSKLMVGAGMAATLAAGLVGGIVYVRAAGPVSVGGSSADHTASIATPPAEVAPASIAKIQVFPERYVGVPIALNDISIIGSVERCEGKLMLTVEGGDGTYVGCHSHAPLRLSDGLADELVDALDANWKYRAKVIGTVAPSPDWTAHKFMIAVTRIELVSSGRVFE